MSSRKISSLCANYISHLSLLLILHYLLLINLINLANSRVLMLTSSLNNDAPLGVRSLAHHNPHHHHHLHRRHHHHLIINMSSIPSNSISSLNINSPMQLQPKSPINGIPSQLSSSSISLSMNGNISSRRNGSKKNYNGISRYQRANKRFVPTGPNPLHNWFMMVSQLLKLFNHFKDTL